MPTNQEIESALSNPWIPGVYAKGIWHPETGLKVWQTNDEAGTAVEGGRVHHDDMARHLELPYKTPIEDDGGWYKAISLSPKGTVTYYDGHHPALEDEIERTYPGQTRTNSQEWEFPTTSTTSSQAARSAIAHTPIAVKQGEWIPLAQRPEDVKHNARFEKGGRPIPHSDNSKNNISNYPYKGPYPPIRNLKNNIFEITSNEPPSIHGPGESVWDTGYCGEYALALRELYPHLRLGEYHNDEGLSQHFFAHDDTHLYDVTGKRPLRPHLNDPGLQVNLDYPAEYAYGDFLQGVGKEIQTAKELIQKHAGTHTDRSDYEILKYIFPSNGDITHFGRTPSGSSKKSAGFKPGDQVILKDEGIKGEVKEQPKEYGDVAGNPVWVEYENRPGEVLDTSPSDLEHYQEPPKYTVIQTTDVNNEDHGKGAPFIVDRERKEIHLGPNGSYHSELPFSRYKNQTAPVGRMHNKEFVLYKEYPGSEVEPEERDAIKKALTPYAKDEEIGEYSKWEDLGVEPDKVENDWKFGASGSSTKLAGETRTQTLKRAEQWDKFHGQPDQSETVHQYPDGWSIRKLQTKGDLNREGQLMGNCWAADRYHDQDYGEENEPFHPEWDNLDTIFPPEEYNEDEFGEGVTIDHLKDYYNWSEPLRAGNFYPHYSLRDPDNLPHVSIGGPDAETFGKHNAEPKDEYLRRIHQWDPNWGAPLSGDPRIGSSADYKVIQHDTENEEYNHDEWDPWDSWPFIVNSSQGEVHVGETGGYHQDFENNIPYKDISAKGRYTIDRENPDDHDIIWHDREYGNEQQAATKALYNHFNAPFGPVDKWKFSSTDPFEMREHDYDPRWDYDVQEDQLNHPLIQQAQRIMDQRAKDPDTPFERGHVYPAPLGDKGVGVYCNGTANEPVVLVDLKQHEGYEDQIPTTVNHEIAHAIQEGNWDGHGNVGDVFDEDEAEDAGRYGSGSSSIQPDFKHIEIPEDEQTPKSLMWTNRRNPLIYHPESNTMYVGPPGEHHHVLETYIPDPENVDNAVQGYFVPTDADSFPGVAHLWDRELAKPLEAATRNHFGVEDPTDWEFNSKIASSEFEVHETAQDGSEHHDTHYSPDADYESWPFYVNSEQGKVYLGRQGGFHRDINTAVTNNETQHAGESAGRFIRDGKETRVGWHLDDDYDHVDPLKRKQVEGVLRSHLGFDSMNKPKDWSFKASEDAYKVVEHPSDDVGHAVSKHFGIPLGAPDEWEFNSKISGPDIGEALKEPWQPGRVGKGFYDYNLGPVTWTNDFVHHDDVAKHLGLKSIFDTPKGSPHPPLSFAIGTKGAMTWYDPTTEEAKRAMKQKYPDSEPDKESIGWDFNSSFKRFARENFERVAKPLQFFTFRSDPNQNKFSYGEEPPSDPDIEDHDFTVLPGKEYLPNRRPFLFDKARNTIHIGPLNALHADLAKKAQIPYQNAGAIHHEEDDQGEVICPKFPDTRIGGPIEVSSYGGDFHPDTLNAVRRHIGIPEEKSWGFEGKSAAIDPKHLPETLYHVTTTDKVPTIQGRGLVPWDVPLKDAPGSAWQGTETQPRPGHVYLTNDPGEIMDGMAEWGGHTIQHRNYRAFPIDTSKLDPNRFNPDEDSRSSWDTPPSKMRPIPTLGDWAEQQDWGFDPDDTKHSLDSMGTLAYRGHIPPEAMGEPQKIVSNSCPHCGRNAYSGYDADSGWCEGCNDEHNSSHKQSDRQRWIDSFNETLPGQQFDGQLDQQNVQWVPVKDLLPYMEYDRDLEGSEYTQDLKDHVTEHGVQVPLILEYNQDTGMAHLSEGNHRLKIMNENGEQYAPVKILSTMRKGQNEHPVPKPAIPDEHGYVPSNMSPSQLGFTVR